MPLNWPVSFRGGNLDADREAQVRASLDSFGTYIQNGLATVSVSPWDTPLWRPWNLLVVWDPQAVWCVFAPNTGGAAQIDWLEHASIWADATLREEAAKQRGWTQVEIVRLPHPGSPGEDAQIEEVARAYVAAAEMSARLTRLGDLTGVEHLEPQLRQFLDDHPDPARNVFVMMRFHPSPQLQSVHTAIVQTLAARNMKGLRADDRVYIDDLWDNIRVYMTGCRYGIAVYEDIDQRDFNPNVAIELGYMLGHEKRCLILKEKRLPTIPADIV
jgi:hypothetical protein